jgi:hypothetical protein
VLLGVYFGQFLFYQYVFLANVQEAEVAASYAKFREKEYHSILRAWEAREGASKNFSPGTYLDPFE